VSDKRRLIIEGEFAATLKVLTREGNTLSPEMRSAWDGIAVLQTITKNCPMTATQPHISIIGHITFDELRHNWLKNIEAQNGFANRILWCCVQRRKLLPDGGNVPETAITDYVARLSEAVKFALAERELPRDPEARQYWREIYADLANEKPGVIGAVTARGEAQVMRLACIYALLDQSAVVMRDHLDAALAVWRYCEASAQYIFSEIAARKRDLILRALQAEPEGLNKSQIHQLFGRNMEAAEIDQALQDLAAHGMAHRIGQKVGSKGGRPEERWVASTNERKNEETSEAGTAQRHRPAA
jgi:hypothetical protein